MRLSVVIPCYNEAHVLRESIRKLIDFLYDHEWAGIDGQFEVILVIEKSSDGTIEIAQEAKRSYPEIKILENEKKYGKGFSVRRGILASKGRTILVVDADLPINLVKYYPLMNFLMKSNEVAAVYTTALADKINIPKRGWKRSLLSFGLFTIRRFGTGREITDSQLGCKLYRGDVIRNLVERITDNGFLYEIQLTDIILDEGFEIEECAVRIEHFSETSSVNLKNMIESTVHFLAYSLYGRKKLLKRGAIQVDVDKKTELWPKIKSIGKFLVLFVIIIFGINRVTMALADINQNYIFQVEQDNQNLNENVTTNVIAGYGNNGSSPNISGGCNDNGNDKCQGNGIGTGKKNDKDN